MSLAGASGHQPENNTLSSPTLTTLPQELRLMVWKQVFEQTVVKVEATEVDNTNPKELSSRRHLHASPSPHPLCYVNRQKYLEAIDLFYEEATFQIDLSALRVQVLPAVSVYQLPDTAHMAIALHNLAAKVRNLSLSVYAYRGDFDRSLSSHFHAALSSYWHRNQKHSPEDLTKMYDLPFPNLKHLRLDWKLQKHGKFSKPYYMAHWEQAEAKSIVRLFNARRTFDVEVHIEMGHWRRTKPGVETCLPLFTAIYTPGALVFNYKPGQKRLEQYETYIRNKLGLDEQTVEGAEGLHDAGGAAVSLEEIN